MYVSVWILVFKTCINKKMFGCDFVNRELSFAWKDSQLFVVRSELMEKEAQTLGGKFFFQYIYWLFFMIFMVKDSVKDSLMYIFALHFLLTHFHLYAHKYFTKFVLKIFHFDK